MRLAIFRPMSVWRVVLLGAVAMATVLWANTAFAQYPGGSRNPARWYYCYASQVNEDSSTLLGNWGNILCETLLWQESSGGGEAYHSVIMQGLAQTLSSSSNAAQLRGYVIPARGVKEITYACDGVVKRVRTGISGAATARARDSETAAANPWVEADGTSWTFSAPAPGVESFPTETQIGYDIVATWRSNTYDHFWDDDIVELWLTSQPVNYGAWVELTVNKSTNFHTGIASYNCQVISWNSWPQWLADNPEWTPGPGDLVPGPTPTPGPGWGSNPWVPITDTTNMPNIGISDPITTTCGTVIPGYEWEWPPLSGEFYNWEPVEFCYEEYDISIDMFGYDLDGYLVVAMLLGGAGVLVSIIKRA